MPTVPGTVNQPNRHKVLTQHPRRLRRRRIEAGLTLEQLGSLAGYTKQHMSALELGQASASPPCLLAVANALGCEIADLLPDEEADGTAA